MTEIERPLEPQDLPSVLQLLHRELGWPDDERAEQLWRWKHEQNPFGASTVRVGIRDGAVVAVRVFMRWSLCDASGTVHRAARAVDTATHADQRRRGWFRRLTTSALAELEADGVTVLFNTPNPQSLPANTSLGWVEQEVPPVWVRVVGPAGAARLLRARTGADLWPVPSSVGMHPDAVWEDRTLASLLRTQRLPAFGQVSTAHSEASLRWRYGLDILGYRMVPTPGGVVAVRTRRRGASVERALLDSWGGRDAWRAALKDSASVDHAIALGARPGRGWWRLPGAGPRVVARPLGTSALPGTLQLVLGDVELL